MEKYLTSQESLELMCGICPDKYLKYGIAKISGGLLSGIYAAFLAYIFFSVMLDNGVPVDFWFDVMSYIVRLFVICMILFFLVIGVFYIADGLFSVAKKFGVHARASDGDIYFRNDGFMKKMSKFDKFFARKITPVDNAENLNSVKDDVFLNGFIITKTEYSSRPITTHEVDFSSSGKLVFRTHFYTEYTSAVTGHFGNRTLTAFINTPNQDIANKLKNLNQGRALYLMGKLNDAGEIKIERWGTAFTEK
jgi:hypothetical protein